MASRTAIPRPAYDGGSILNLAASIIKAGGGSRHPSARLLPPRELRRAKRILIIIDGLGYDWLRERGKGSFLAAHLRGALTSVFPPTTASAMTTINTGLSPREHGVTGWFVQYKEAGMLLAPLPPRTRSFGLTVPVVPGLNAPSLFERARQRRGVEILPRRVVSSPYNKVVSRGAVLRAYETMRGFFRQAGAAVKGQGLLLVKAYWPGYDSLSHQYGPASRKVREHFRELDRAVERLAERLNETLLVVTADHGFTAVKERLRVRDHPLLEEALAAPFSGESRAPYCLVHAGQRERFEAYVRQRLGRWCELWRSEELLAEGLLGPPGGADHPMLRHRLGDYALVMKPGCIFTDELLGEEAKRHRGVHGGLSREEMFVPLIVIKR